MRSRFRSRRPTHHGQGGESGIPSRLDQDLQRPLLGVPDLRLRGDPVLVRRRPLDSGRDARGMQPPAGPPAVHAARAPDSADLDATTRAGLSRPAGRRQRPVHRLAHASQLHDSSQCAAGDRGSGVRRRDVSPRHPRRHPSIPSDPSVTRRGTRRIPARRRCRRWRALRRDTAGIRRRTLPQLAPAKPSNVWNNTNWTVDLGGGWYLVEQDWSRRVTARRKVRKPRRPRYGRVLKIPFKARNGALKGDFCADSSSLARSPDLDEVNSDRRRTFGNVQRVRRDVERGVRRGFSSFRSHSLPPRRPAGRMRSRFVPMVRRSRRAASDRSSDGLKEK